MHRPCMVPKLNVALLTVVAVVTPESVKVNVAVCLRNGLCLLPAIELLAAA